MLQAEVEHVRYTSGNIFTALHMVETWLEHFRENIFSYVHGKERLAAIVYDGRPILCIGAGPSVKDKQLALLKGRDDIFVIAVNKITERLLKYRVPDLVLTIHGTDEILKNFEGPRMAKALGNGMKIAVSTMTDPKVSAKIMAHARPECVYWFNMSMPEAYMANIDAMMKLMSYQLPTFDTGGNVGLCAMIFAREQLGATIIAFMGLETCLKLEQIGSDALARECQIVYVPEKKQLFAVPPVFNGYAQSMGAFIKGTRDKCDYVNLTPVGIPYVNEKEWGIRTMALKDFLMTPSKEMLILNGTP